MHANMVNVSGVPAPVLAAIRAGQPIPDAKLAALYAFARELVQTAGKPGQAVAALFVDTLLAHLAAEDAWLAREDEHQKERLKTHD